MKFFKNFIILLFTFSIILITELIIDFDTLKYSNNFNIPKKIDLIVVLTGQKGRIKHGLIYLKKLHARYLIISGANPKSSKENILMPYKDYKEFFKQIIIENISTNTYENALQLKLLIKRFKKPLTILIITSTTHLKRAKFIFSKIFKNPEIQIFFIPAPEKITLKKVLIEKIKYFFDYFYFAINNNL